MKLARGEAWPALALMAIAFLSLALVLKSAQGDLPVRPLWILPALTAFYLLLALYGAGWRWRAVGLFLAMIAAHGLLALWMGCGYAAIEGRPRSLEDAFLHGLGDYLPGTALQFGYACFVGIIFAAWLERPQRVERAETAREESTGEEEFWRAMAEARDLPAALEATMKLRGVAGVLMADGQRVAIATGNWAADPQGARKRIDAFVRCCGEGRHILPLGEASLLWRAEGNAFMALLVTAPLNSAAGHEILSALWSKAAKAKSLSC